MKYFYIASTMLLALFGGYAHAEDETQSPGSEVFVVARVFEDEGALTRMGKADIDYLIKLFPGMRVLLQGDMGYLNDDFVGGGEVKNGHSMYFEVPKQRDRDVFTKQFPSGYHVGTYHQFVPLKAVVKVDKVFYSGTVEIPLKRFGGGNFPGLPDKPRELILEYGTPEIAKHLNEPGFKKTWFATNYQYSFHSEGSQWLEVDHHLRLSQELNWKRSRIVPLKKKK